MTGEYASDTIATMINLEMEPVPKPPMSKRKVKLIGLAALGGMYALSYGAMHFLPLSEQPAQERVRVCAALLDAPTIDPSTIRHECTELGDLPTQSVVKDDQVHVTTIYPTGDAYIAQHMPEAIDTDANWIPINNNIIRGLGAGLATSAVVIGAAFAAIRSDALARTN